jgi:hypothetical protein
MRLCEQTASGRHPISARQSTGAMSSRIPAPESGRERVTEKGRIASSELWGTRKGLR